MRWKFPLELTPEVRGCLIRRVLLAALIIGSWWLFEHSRQLARREVYDCFISGVKEMGIDIKGDEIVREDSSELFKEYLDLPDYRKKFTAEQLMNYQLAKCAKLTD